MPVVATKDQAAWLKSADPKLAANKRLAYDFYRIVIRGGRLDEAAKYMREDYIQHNPNVATGRKGFVEFFAKMLGEKGAKRPVPAELGGLVAIQAEGDHVTLSFVDEREDETAPGGKFTTTWFDMFRVQDGKIAEHWDTDEWEAPEVAPPVKKKMKP